MALSGGLIRIEAIILTRYIFSGAFSSLPPDEIRFRTIGLCGGWFMIVGLMDTGYLQEKSYEIQYGPDVFYKIRNLLTWP